MDKKARKVILIGWDAADWKIIHPLMDAGKMPALQRLVSEGVSGNLSTLEPPFSPMLWTSVATGKYADKHGILGFTEPVFNNLGIRPVSSYSRKTKAIWNILSQEGYKSHVLGWWPSNPAEPINGIMLSNHYQQAIKKFDQNWPLSPGTVHPEILSSFFAELRVHPQEISDEMLYPFVPLAAEIDQKSDKRLQAIARTIAESASLQAAATWILDTQACDFLAVYFDAIDHFCHMFMNYHPPRLPHIPERDFDIYNNVVAAAYQFHDMMLDQLMLLAGDDATIILVSDHGFQTGSMRTDYISDEPAGPADHHRQHGIICMKGPGIKKDELLYGPSLLNITPTILTLFGLPVGLDMDGIPIIQAFAEQTDILYVPSWDLVEGDAGMLPKIPSTQPSDNQKALQQLIDLGYIADPGNDKTLAAKSTELETNYNLARVYIGSFRFSEAIPILHKLCTNTNRGRFVLRLAKCYIETGKNGPANEILEKYIENAQAKLTELNKRFFAHEKQTETPEKVTKEKGLQQIARGIITLETNLVQARLLQLDIRSLTEAPETLLAELDKKFPKNSRPIALQRKFADLYFKLGNFGEAENIYLNILRTDADNPDTHERLSQTYLAQKNYQEAVSYALNAIGLNYFQPMSHFTLGKALLKMDYYEQAADAFEVCLKIIPHLGHARNMLINLYAEKLDKPLLAQKHTDYFKNTGTLLADNPNSGPLLEISEYQSKFIELKDPIVVVSGLPRSGTSMAMQMLEAGGISIFSDRNRLPDPSNPRGYYEHELVKTLAQNNRWLHEVSGKAVKIIAQLLPYLPAKYNYKILFMLRDMREIVSSQHKMLVGQGKQKKEIYPADLELIFKDQLEQTYEWLKGQHNIAVLYLQHSETIMDPGETANKIRDFLGVELDTKGMTDVVDKRLYREKKRPADG